VFLFIDSPYKQRAARRLASCLIARNFFVLLLLPALAAWAMEFLPSAGCTSVAWEGWKALIKETEATHLAIIVGALLCTLYHWCFLGWLFFCNPQFRSMPDIFSACKSGDVEQVQGARRLWTFSPAVNLNLNIADVDGNTPLMLAAANGHTQVCELLLSEGGDIGVRSTRRKWTAVHIAARRGDAEVLRVLLSSHDSHSQRHRQEQDLKDEAEETPLHIAARAGHNDAVLMLLAYCPSWANAKNRDLRTPAEVASPATRRVIEQQHLASQELGLPQQESWPGVAFQLTRAPKAMAPGLCSHLVDSCGLGRVARSGPEDQIRGLSFTLLTDLEPIDSEGNRVYGWSWGDFPQRPPRQARLGAGAYGYVWRAKHKCTPTWYAIKQMAAPHGDQLSAGAREFEVADHIRLQPHPCIVRPWHIEDLRNCKVLVMEFCPGGDLQTRIRSAWCAAQTHGQYMPPAGARLWVGQIFLGLEHLHLRMRTLLRDLKPENVVLDRDGCAKLTDFGFGRVGVASNGRWSFNFPTGSPGYCAPEVLHQEEYNDSVDMYSLGVLIWVLLSGGVGGLPAGAVTAKRKLPFSAYYNDWRCLREHVENPREHNVQSLDPDAKSLVLSLVCQSPMERLDHSGIRQHPFMRSVGRLPPFSATLAEVEGWLHRIVAGRAANFGGEAL